jgi:hypothetical protein
MHPRKADLQQLMYLDYAVIYSSDVGGPESLHTPVPLRGGEYATRRQVIEYGLFSMAARSFVDVVAGEDGILYGIGENGSSLIELIEGPYASRLATRCQWVADTLGDKPGHELEIIFGSKDVLWGAHFVELRRE